MFSVKHNECVGFESKWKVKKVSTSNATQTTEFSQSEKGCNTSELKTHEIQTEPITKHTSEVDMEKLAAWLKKVYPKVNLEIEKTNKSKAFKNYRLSDGPVDVTCKLIQNINVTSRDSESKATPIISNLQWNCNGKSLAVPINYKHKTWCHHSGTVCIYSLTRKEVLSDTPTKRLSTESCVTTSQFHPTFSGVYAAGTFTGHVNIWDIENDVDPLICSIEAHNEFVTQVSWVRDIDSTKFACLATSSTDGLMKMWNFNVTENFLQHKITYKIKTPLLAKINQSTEVAKSLIDKGDLGVVCFDFSLYLPDVFVVALEGGLIVQCSVLGTTKVKGNKKEDFYDPVFKYYEPHLVEITAIKFDLHAKDRFLTCGIDGEIRIFILGQDEPAKVIFTKSSVNDLSFVLNQEKLLAVCSSNGTLEVYQLITGKPIQLNFDTQVTKWNLSSLAINKAKTNFVVVGNNNGELHLWNIPWQNIESRTSH